MVLCYKPKWLQQWQQPTTKPTVSTVAAAHCVTFGYKYGTPHGVKYLRGLDTNQRAIFARLHQDSSAVRDGLRKAYEKCNDIPRESRALIGTFLKESSEKDRKLHLFMYGKATQLEKQICAKLAWLREKYFYRTRKGIDSLSSQANCSLTEKELHQLRVDEEALRETLEEEAMNKKAQEEKIRQKQAEDNVLFLEFGIVRYDSEYESSD
ncbi:hypothetical protein Tco_1067744 [Tanacetum coccineum]|uniref:Uncharacterized protein n=1 Tax=Tanacetum coccineum TaxID=301880 RepID=A0ABQ5HDR9_9ASTR